MRTENISYTVNGNQRTGMMEYPDLWCFAFNPNYVTISLDDKKVNSELTLTLSTDTKSYDIFVSLYHGEAKAYISKIIQLLIEDVEHYRSAVVRVVLKDGNVEMLLNHISFVAVWGGLQIGEQFGKYGAFVFNGKDISHVRNVVWFKHFPFYVSLFRAESGELVSARYDNNEADANLRIFRCRIGSVVEGNLPEFNNYSKILTNPLIVLNRTHGVVYAYERALVSGNTKAFSSWGASGIYGGLWDYMNFDGTIKDDTEFEYNGNIVRWNSKTKQLEKADVGNAETEGIFEVNPAITFPNAKRTAQYNICLEKVTSGIFNMNFDFAFPDTSKIVNETVNLVIDNSRNGLYLRWIDRYGLIQYYLFVEGTSTIKAKASSDVVRIERTLSGLSIGNLERNMEVSNVESRKCCAVNLPKDILEYVKTIINAPIIDLYYGKSNGGTELWLPVNVSDGSYSTDPDTMLSDYEITIQFPEKPTQTL